MLESIQQKRLSNVPLDDFLGFIDLDSLVVHDILGVEDELDTSALTASVSLTNVDSIPMFLSQSNATL